MDVVEIVNSKRKILKVLLQCMGLIFLSFSQVVYSANDKSSAYPSVEKIRDLKFLFASGLGRDKVNWALYSPFLDNSSLWTVFFFVEKLGAKNFIEALDLGQKYFTSIKAQLTYPDSEPCTYCFDAKQGGYAIFAVKGMHNANKELLDSSRNRIKVS